MFSLLFLLSLLDDRTFRGVVEGERFGVFGTDCGETFDPGLDFDLFEFFFWHLTCSEYFHTEFVFSIFVRIADDCGSTCEFEHNRFGCDVFTGSDRACNCRLVEFEFLDFVEFDCDCEALRVRSLAGRFAFRFRFGFRGFGFFTFDVHTDALAFDVGRVVAASARVDATAYAR